MGAVGGEDVTGRGRGVEPARIGPFAGRGAPGVGTVLVGRARDALEILLRGLESAAARDPGGDLRSLVARDPGGDLRSLVARDPELVHRGLLTVILRLVFMGLAEARGLLPVEPPGDAAHPGIFALFEQLHADAPAALARRCDAWPRLLATWRALSAGSDTPPGPAGEFFDPRRYPFLADDPRAPPIDDLTVHGVLERLLVHGRARLSYRDLDVALLGSLYEALMGDTVAVLAAPGVCLRPLRVWVTAADLRAAPRARRAACLRDEVGLSRAAAARLADALERVDDDAAALELLAAARVRGTDILAAGRLVIQPGPGRRRSRAHYTPRALTESVVRRTLEPLLAGLGREPPAAALLGLRVCDPAMGCGAFLLAVVRVLADQVAAAWLREGEQAGGAGRPGDLVTHARRLVARRCVHGVDKDACAVELARLSLWLVTRARGRPFTCHDERLRCGDALVGLSLAQLAGFHWEPAAALAPVERELQQLLAVTAAQRRRTDGVADIDDTDDIAGHAARADLQRRRDRLRLIADLALGAFFASDTPREREQARRRRAAQVVAWLESGGPPPAELTRLQAELHAAQRPFHWPLEFPEVFLSDAAAGAAGMDAVVGNPPFMGGSQVSGAFGDVYLAWLLALHPGAHGNADLAAHFLRRADALLGARGSIGMIATNTIGQGDTRATGLQHLVAARGYTIYDATRSMPWPEAAVAVAISIVHLARASPCAAIAVHDPDPERPGALVTRRVPAIDSRLDPAPERPDPARLPANGGLGFAGAKIYGQGFLLTPDEREALIRSDPRNAARISPYLGGEEINTDPAQGFARHVINFGQRTLGEAERWPDLLEIVRARVKPERDRNNRALYRQKWWQFGEPRPGLNAALAGLRRCITTSIHSKHLIFALQPVDRVFSHALVVVALEAWTAFATLQSRVHAVWARALGSTLEDRLRYLIADCLEPFPFPRPDPRAVIPALEAIGERLHDARAEHTRTAGHGLTRTYNALRDPACADPAIVRLRDLHLDLDRAVLAAHGWTDIAVPPFTTPRTPLERRAVATFEDAVLNRLFALNAARVAAAVGADAALL